MGLPETFSSKTLRRPPFFEGVRPAGDPVDSDPGDRFPGAHPTSSSSALRPWMCHHARKPTALSRISVPPFLVNFDRFHQPCLLPRRTLGQVRTVIPVPRGDHLPLRAAWSSLLASHWRYTAGRKLALHPLRAPPATHGC